MKIKYLILVCMIIGCTPKATKEKYCIPYGFKGQVFIFFNRKDGAEKKYENGYRIYDIPKDGVLKTQFKPNYGYQNVGEYIYVYVDSLNREIPLKMHERDDSILNNKEVYITAQETGGGGTKNEYEYQTFNVKTIDEKLILKNRDPLLMDDILKKVGLK